MRGIKICATGSYLPGRVVQNEDYTAFVETSDEWISTRTGIHSRHIADGDTTWRMGAQAARHALETAGISPEKVGLIICTTITADYSTPSTACIIQNELGAVNAFAFDLNAACTGFVYALDVAQKYLVSGEVDTALIISTEMMSRIVDYTDRSICVLFGDGAGAAVVQAADSPYASALHAEGDGYHLIYCKNDPPVNPFTSTPPQADLINATETAPHTVVQQGKDVYKFATHAIPAVAREVCAKAGMRPEELRYIIPHQANARIVQTAMKNLGLPVEQAWLTIEHVGNTSSASIPIALDELFRAGTLQKGDRLCLVGFGAGLAYGAAIFEYEG